MTSKGILVWLAVAGTAAAMAGRLASERPDPPLSGSEAPARAQAGAPAAEDRLAARLRRDALDEPRGALFGARSWTPPAAPAAQPQAPAEPAPPPLPYRAVGRVVHEGKLRIVLARGNRVVLVRAGDPLEDGYRVESVQPDAITLLYVPLGTRATLPLDFAADFAAAAEAAAAPAPLSSRPAAAADALPSRPAAAADALPAELRWEGPDSVRVGSTFDVVLKVTAGEAVRGSPFQLAFTADLLEAVAVKPGRFYAGANFSYRVNPKGFITIGASRSESVPIDADFLVLTFRPTRAGAGAEVKVASVVLQGGGGTIAHHQPALFRTTIVQ